MSDVLEYGKMMQYLVRFCHYFSVLYFSGFGYISKRSQAYQLDVFSNGNVYLLTG